MYNKIVNFVRTTKIEFPFKYINDTIRKYECVKEYQGEPFDWHAAGSWATRSHVITSTLLALLSPLGGLVWPELAPIGYYLAFLIYSPFMELWFQYEKEKNKPLWDVMAQMIERGYIFGPLSMWWFIIYLIKVEFLTW